MNWKHFLTSYSHDLADRTDYLDWAEVPQFARAAKWFGYDPASVEQIEQTERALGIALPADLREFYRVTNGWMLCGASVYDIRPIEGLQRLLDSSRWTLGDVDPTPPRDKHLREYWYETGIKVCRSLVLNTRGDDALLLFDPSPDLPPDECRYGTWAAWNPGIEWTTHTFWEYFQKERETLLPILD